MRKAEIQLNFFLKQTEINPAIIILSTTANHRTIRGYLSLLMIMSVDTAAKHSSFVSLINQIKIIYGKILLNLFT